MALYRLDDRHDARSWHRWRVIAPTCAPERRFNHHVTGALKLSKGNRYIGGGDQVCVASRKQTVFLWWQRPSQPQHPGKKKSLGSSSRPERYTGSQSPGIRAAVKWLGLPYFYRRPSTLQYFYTHHRPNKKGHPLGRPFVFSNALLFNHLSGADTRSRTRDLLITRTLLTNSQQHV